MQFNGWIVDKRDNFMITGISHQVKFETSGDDIITKSAHELPLLVH